MKRTINYYMPYIAILLLLFSCAKIADIKERNNPFDPKGTDYQLDDNLVAYFSFDTGYQDDTGNTSPKLVGLPVPSSKYHLFPMILYAYLGWQFGESVKPAYYSEIAITLFLYVL